MQAHANSSRPWHSCHTSGSNMGHKGRKWFQTGNEDLERQGQGVHIPPSAHTLQLLGKDSRSPRDAHIISCLALISTHGQNRHSCAWKCANAYTQMNPLLHCTHTHSCMHPCPTIPPTSYPTFTLFPTVSIKAWKSSFTSPYSSEVFSVSVTMRAKDFVIIDIKIKLLRDDVTISEDDSNCCYGVSYCIVDGDFEELTIHRSCLWESCKNAML